MRGGKSEDEWERVELRTESRYQIGNDGGRGDGGCLSVRRFVLFMRARMCVCFFGRENAYLYIYICLFFIFRLAKVFFTKTRLSTARRNVVYKTPFRTIYLYPAIYTS